MKPIKKHPIWLIPDEVIFDLVIEHSSYAEILRALGFKKSAHTALAKRIKELNLSTEHFEQEHAGHGGFEKLYPQDVLIKDSPYSYTTARRIYRRLPFIKYECRECGQKPIWNGKALVLVFDHSNGDHNDHSLKNVRWLCPNCNSQTDTFTSKNRGNPLNKNSTSRKLKKKRNR